MQEYREVPISPHNFIGMTVEVDEFGEAWLTPEQVALVEETLLLLAEWKVQEPQALKVVA